MSDNELRCPHCNVGLNHKWCKMQHFNHIGKSDIFEVICSDCKHTFYAVIQDSIEGRIECLTEGI